MRIQASEYHVISQAGVGLPAATQATQRIEHAGAQEADEGDHAQLELGRGIPAEGAQFRVHPSCGTRALGDGVMALQGGGGGCSADAGSFGFAICHGDSSARVVDREGGVSVSVRCQRVWRESVSILGFCGEIGENKRREPSVSQSVLLSHEPQMPKIKTTEESNH